MNREYFELAYNRKAVSSSVAYHIFSECVESFSWKSVINGISVSQAIALMLDIWRRGSVVYGFRRLDISRFDLYDRVRFEDRRQEIVVRFTLKTSREFRRFCISKDLLPYEGIAYLLYSYVDLTDSIGSSHIVDLVSILNSYPFIVQE